MPVDEMDDSPFLVATAGSSATRNRSWLLDAGIVFVIAVVLRLVLVGLSHGGPSGDFGYDAGVYYNAADALIHGRLPYHDFLLLHPPALMLALTPVAGLGQLIGDHAAFMFGNTLFSIIGGLSAVLVMRIAHRMGLSRGPQLVGGLFYATWFGAVFSEVSARLEPLGSFALLLGMWALTGERSRRALVLGGAALGFAASVKIWWGVPMIILLGWQFAVRPRSDGLRALLGGVGALVLINGPFFVLAPANMTRMIIADQFQRTPNAPSRIIRFGRLSSINSAFPHITQTGDLVLAVVFGIVVAGLIAAAWRCPPARVAVIVAAGNVIVLFLAPTYNAYYSGFAAAGLAVLVAAACAQVPGRLARVGPTISTAVLLTMIVFTSSAIFVQRVSVASPFPQGLAPKVAHVRCVIADSPIALIQLNALSRALADDCPNWVDVTGHTYDDDRDPGRHGARHLNRPWQKAIRRYLISGNAFVVIRRATGLDRRTKMLLHRYPVLVEKHGVVVRRVTG